MLEQRTHPFEGQSINVLHTRQNYYNNYNLSKMRLFRDLIQRGYNPVGMTVYTVHESMTFTEDDRLHYMLLYKNPDIII